MTPDEFVRKVCHDLRAPLRGLKELPVWLEEDLTSAFGPLPEEARELIHMMRDQAARMDDMVLGLSALAKVERRVERPTCSARSLMADLGAERLTSAAISAGPIPMEAEHLKQVLVHLIDNAQRHGKAPAPEIHLDISTRAEGALLTVTDNGPGIPSEDRRSVFEPLMTLKPRDECEGSGIGLAIVARIAALYGGTCSVEDSPSGGASFRVFLPARPLSLQAAQTRVA